jgi:hypothetical protein
MYTYFNNQREKDSFFSPLPIGSSNSVYEIRGAGHSRTQ